MSDLTGQAGDLRMSANKLVGPPPVMHMTIQVTRAATGKVEEYKLTGTPLPESEPMGEEPEQE